ncbi:MAG: DNA replication and repair protein RecF, partial [Clostridia bacterium]|nr:DNA replication and repair protein RecF [Clostridia bacterium]
SQREIAEELKEGLFATLERDMILGYTTMGPHRDDLKITVNDEDVRAFGSQGQQRTAALSLKIAELEIYKEHFGEAPVLILDDALSELDKSRQKRLVRLLEGVQTIITCTHVDEEVFEGMEYKKFVVEEGTIRG